jgi:hypothetical protein
MSDPFNVNPDRPVTAILADIKTGAAAAANPNNQGKLGMAFAPFAALLVKLSQDAERATRTIITLSEKTDKATRTIIWLTWAPVGLTVIIAILTLALVLSHR